MNRKLASNLIQELSVLPGRMEAKDLIEGELESILENWFFRYQIPAAQACSGDAHSNPNIDNCGQCAPHWGWIVPSDVKVR